MAVKIINDKNIFTTECQTLVNPVNCVGVMGAGIALEYRLRFPEMFDKYKDFCQKGKLEPGKLWIYESDKYSKWVLLFPTKIDWKHPSKIEYIELGLKNFVDTYQKRNVNSIAFPLLGTDKGGLDPEIVKNLMTTHLDKIDDINVEIYEYNPLAKDDLFDVFKNHFLHNDIDVLTKELNISILMVNKIKTILSNQNLCQINQLSKEKGIGMKTLEQIFQYYLVHQQSRQFDTDKQASEQLPLGF